MIQNSFMNYFGILKRTEHIINECDNIYSLKNNRGKSCISKIDSLNEYILLMKWYKIVMGQKSFLKHYSEWYMLILKLIPIYIHNTGLR